MMDKNPATDAILPKYKAEEREIWTAEMLMQAINGSYIRDQMQKVIDSDEEALKDFWDYCEERQREERIISEMKTKG